MNYWLDLFTWKTWQEFLDAGGEVSGFRDSRWKTVKKMKKGDLLLCYMTGISRFFAILEVTGKPFRSEKPIWAESVFPSRIPVRVVLELEPEYAIRGDLVYQSQTATQVSYRVEPNWVLIGGVSLYMLFIVVFFALIVDLALLICFFPIIGLAIFLNVFFIGWRLNYLKKQLLESLDGRFPSS